MFLGYHRFGCNPCDCLGGYGDGPCGGYYSYWDRYRWCGGLGNCFFCSGCLNFPWQCILRNGCCGQPWC